MLSTAQKFLLATGGILAAYWVLKPSDAMASTASSATPSTGGGTPIGTGPAAGDRLLVQTNQTGLPGSLYVRTNPGTNYPEVTYVAHGSYVTATGNAKNDANGVAWWEITTTTGQKGWSESIYLQDTGPGMTA